MAKIKQSTSWSLGTFVVLTVASFSLMNACTATPYDMQSPVCDTQGCAEAAQLVLKNMDTSINPCDDFYNFACGKYIEETVIPEDRSSVSLFSKIDDLLQNQLKQTLEGPLQKGDPRTFKLTQSFYNVCLDTDKIEKTGTKDLTSILNSIGNWPVVIGQSWNQSKFDWQRLVHQLRKIGYTGSMNSLINFNIEHDEKNTTRRTITLDQAATGLSQEYLSNGLEDRVVQAYLQYKVDLAVILGAEPEQAQKELTESVNFEIELAKISLAQEDRRNQSELYNPMTVAQLQCKYPFVSWIQYLNNILLPYGQIKKTDQVIVRVPSFLESLPKLLTKTSKRVLANYMIGRVVQASAGYLNKEMRDARTNYSAAISGTKVERPRYTTCIGYLSDSLTQALGALYVRKSFDNNTKGQVENLVTELRQSFDSMLDMLDWMDEKTKKTARVKLNAIRQWIAYPNEFFDNEKLDKYYKNLSVDPNSFLKSSLRNNLFLLDYAIKQLRKPVDKNDWVTHGYSAVVNAFYDPPENSIIIPAGILQGEFFTSTRPSYMNFGSVGYVIGHEITHAFDDQGSQYDEDGNLVNWWDDNTKKEYLKRAQCIIDQYSNYTVEEVGLKINGKNTQGENIADNGGIKEAYLAYENFEKQNGEEPRLPGLQSYSPRQMFWISAANNWCEKTRPEALKNLVIIDVHSPGKYRVIVPFSNMPQFARDFECPAGSPMNPVEKCTVW